MTRALAKVGTELYVTKQLSPAMATLLEEVNLALNETRQFSSEISGWSTSKNAKEYHQQVALIHAVDHLGRLSKALGEEGAAETLNNNKTVQRLSEEMKILFMEIQQLTYECHVDLLQKVKMNSLEIAELRRLNRKEIIEKTVLHQADVDAAIHKVHALHWIDRVAYHQWRSIRHLDKCLVAENSEVELDEED